MKKNSTSIIVAVVLLLVIGISVYVYLDAQEQLRIADEKTKQEQLVLEQKRQAVEEEMKRLKCVDGDTFSVVTRDRKDSVGQDILVKAKGANGAGCAYVTAEGDFELVNSDAQYYKAQAVNALVTDVGTGPSGRMFRLYDLKDKSLITEKKYFGDLVVASGTLTYFGEAKQKADTKNCKEIKELTKDGLSAVLTIEKKVDLSTFLVKEGKTTKCVVTQ